MQGNGPGNSDREVIVNTFPNITTRELLAINAQQIRWYNEDPSQGNRDAVIETGSELTRRGC